MSQLVVADESATILNEITIYQTELTTLQKQLTTTMTSNEISRVIETIIQIIEKTRFEYQKLTFEYRKQQLQQQFDAQLKQTQFQQKMVDAESTLNEKMNSFEKYINQQQLELDQRKLALDQREFQLQQREAALGLSCQTKSLTTIPTTPLSNDNLIATAEGMSLEYVPQQSTTMTIANQSSTYQSDLKEFMCTLLEDYEVMKYLVNQNTQTHENIHQHLTFIESKTNGLLSLQSTLQQLLSFSDKFQSLQSLSTTHFTSLSTQLTTLDNSIQLQWKHKLQREEQKKKEVESLPHILKTNLLTMKGNANAIIDFEVVNLKDVVMSCGSWTDESLHVSFYTNLIQKSIPHHFPQSLITKIQKGKVFISSPAVRDGQFIQIQGEGAEIDPKVVRLFSFIRYGELTIPYRPCDKLCLVCNGSPPNTVTRRYPIKFKWEL